MAGHFGYAIRFHSLNFTEGVQAHQVEGRNLDDPFREERPMLSEAAIQRLPGEFFLDKTWRNPRNVVSCLGQRSREYFLLGFRRFSGISKLQHLISSPSFSRKYI